MTFAPDGSIYVPGFLHYSRPSCTCDGFSVVHFKADGTLDASFGNDRVVPTIVGSPVGSFAQAVTVQSDGKVLAAGFTFRFHGATSLGLFALVRYNADGSRDQTFGSHGRVVTRFGDDDAMAVDVRIDAEGRAVAAGTAGRDFALARYLG